MTVAILRGDARHIPLPDGCVDLIVTSPPYFGLRSYTDAGAHYGGQIGSEATPQEWLAAMVECTREWVRVLKPEGSIFINLGDKYAGSGGNGNSGLLTPKYKGNVEAAPPSRGQRWDHLPKSLLGLPWRYALACTDQLGLILRRDIIWAKPNGLPESVTDRCRSSHEYVFHLVRQPRYYAAVDEIREPQLYPFKSRTSAKIASANDMARGTNGSQQTGLGSPDAQHPLGKLPGSVWDIPSQPLTVPAHLGVDHFACVDTETEILTPRGWLRHDQLTAGDQVGGYDLDTNTARWTDCTAVNRYDYDGEMIAVESRDVSMRLTPNHRTIVQRMHTRAKRRNPVSVVRADELDRYHFIPRSAAWDRFGDCRVTGRLAAVLGWVAAEGWYRGNHVFLAQSLTANPASVADIDRLIPDAKRRERKRERDGRAWVEVEWTLGPMGNLVRQVMPDKLLPWWLTESTEEERRGVLNAFIDGDGHRRPDGRIGIFQKHRHNLDVLQAVAVTLGYKTTLRESGGRFVLYLTEGGRSVTLRGTAGVGSKVRREHYRGVVWCPTTGTGTFIARRNGSVFVTGNSFPVELPRRIVLGWSPPGVCVACGQGRRPVGDRDRQPTQRIHNGRSTMQPGGGPGANWEGYTLPHRTTVTITGYVCACSEEVMPDETVAQYGRHVRGAPLGLPPTRPAVVLDPFMGTGTTLLAAAAYGRNAIGIDRSADYCRLAQWRTTDPGERAKAMQVPKPPPIPDGMEALF